MPNDKPVGLGSPDLPRANLLVTKLTAPVYPLRTVRRERLTSLMQEGMQHRLMLIVAPAGYGKTTLIREWTSKFESPDWPIAWVQLDKEDSGMQFWTYFVAALQTIEPDIHFGFLEGIETCLDKSECVQLNSLINQIAGIRGSFSVVLDDYHEIQSEIVHQTLAYLIDHMPENLHLIIASRTIPPFPLARWRIRQQMAEIFETDLSFNQPETEAYLDKVMGLSITEADLHTLLGLTEGWIAGIQMAVLSLKAGRDIQSVLKDLSGGFHLILEYLTDEVLNRQTEEIRQFLIKSSVFSMMTAPLCDDVLEINDSFQKLEYLEQANLFIVPLDDQRCWYRYHSLFRDYLRLYLERSFADQIPLLHQRASTWFENNHHPELAIPHALAIDDYEKAAACIEACIRQTFLRSDLLIVLQWADRLPKEIFLKRPRLALLMILARVSFGQREELTKILIDLNEVLSQAIDEENALTADESLRQTILMVRAVAACIQSDYGRAIELASQTMSRLKAQDSYLAGMLSHFLHYAYLAEGDLDKSAEMLSNGLSLSQSHGMDREHLSSMCYLGRINKYRGRLQEAANIYQEALDYANKKAVGLTTIGYISVGLGDIFMKWGQLDAAGNCISRIHPLTSPDQTSYLEWNFAPDYFLIIAQYFLILKDYETAKSYISLAKSVLRKYYKVPFLAAQTRALEVRYWIAVGDLPQIGQWISEMENRLGARSEHVSSIEILALARIFLALGKARRASELLLNYLPRDKQIPIVECQIEMNLLKALVLYKTGERAGAKAAFLTALLLAAPGGFVQTFIDEGVGLKPLFLEVLDDLQKGHFRADFSTSLAGFLKNLHPRCISAWSEENPPVEKSSAPLPILFDPLSGRELEVLRLLSDGNNPKQIAAQMCISINTARTHIKNIYQKLYVHNREEAIEKAILYNLL